MSKKTLGYVPFGTGRHQPFDQVYGRSMKVTEETIRRGDVDALVIWGGEDISPRIYGQTAGRWTGAGNELSMRDHIEVSVCNAAIASGIPIIGVCRGAQLACALAGGKLVQHVNHHGGLHDIVCDDGEIRTTNSYHHQMQYPYDVEHKLIAFSKETKSEYGDRMVGKSSVYLGETDTDMALLMQGKEEAEIVYYPKIRALAIQGHPEFMGADDPFVAYCNDLIREYL